MKLKILNDSHKNISSANVSYQRPWLYPKQQAAIFDPARICVMECSTKSGKTVGCIVWLLEQAMHGAKGQNFWWVSPVYPQAEIAYRRIKAGLPREVYNAKDYRLTIELVNGATIWFKSGEKPDTLYGEDVYAVVIDEAARAREEAWHAIRSTITATRGPVRIITNVKGRKNWAYRLARRAESGEKDMAYHKIIAADAVAAGILSAEEIEGARAVLPAHVFAELYLAEASDEGGNPFGIEAIHRNIAPLSTGPVSAWGWDLAKSVDWTVGVGLDSAGRVCRFERWQGPWEMTFSKILAITGNIGSLVDSTGVGDPVLERLQKHGSRGNFEGYQFSQSNKQKLMENLSVAIQKNEISYPEGPIVSELESFEYEYTRSGVHYRAAEGLFDDCVCALALAVWKLGHVRRVSPLARLHLPSMKRKSTWAIN